VCVMPEKNASVTRAAAAATAPAAAVSPSDLLGRFIALEWREPGAFCTCRLQSFVFIECVLESTKTWPRPPPRALHFSTAHAQTSQIFSPIENWQRCTLTFQNSRHAYLPMMSMRNVSI
jgi:hypothetical protein